MLDRVWLSKRLQHFPQRTIPPESLRPAAVLIPLLICAGALAAPMCSVPVAA